ncbi:Tripartite tricarboxylate transporter family receptor [compost metagenome]
MRYDIGIWFGLLAPAATPEPIVRQLAEATQRIVAQEDFSRKLEQIGAQATATTPAALRTFMEEEVQTWKGLAKSMPELQKAVELR